MKTKTRRSLYAVLSALFVSTASLAVFAACGGGGKKAKLTLSAGEGGTLSKTEYSVKVGTDLSEFLKDKAPTVTVEGITFAWWYNGTQTVEGATMPEEDLTLTAKYNTGYTVNVYTWDDDSAAYGAAEQKKGTAFWHEPFDIFDVYEMPEGYEPDETKTNKTSTQSLAANETFDLYQKPGEVYVSFVADAPDGVEIGGQMPAKAATFGKAFTVPACAFTAPANYRLTGWATEKGGAVVYHEGDSFKVEKDVTLYGVWEEGKTDVFGGDDYLFLSDKEDEIWLRRAGLEEKKGSYDGATGLFEFTEGSTTVLGGKLIEDYYYYFRDLADKTFRFNGDADETLVFGEKDAATYTVTPQGKEPVVTQGTYTADLETGDYLFEGGNTSFFFALAIERSGDVTTYSFVRTVTGVGEERGFYAFWTDDEKGYDDTQAFQLDGMYDANGFASVGLYVLESGKYERQITTYYGRESEVVDHNDDIFGTLEPDDENFALLRSSTEYVLFRIEEKEFTANGRTFKGVLRLEDGYRGALGNFDEAIKEGKTSLTLDGFGNATYKNVKMPYTVETLEAHGSTFQHIALNPTSENPLYIQLYNYGGQLYYEESGAQPKIVEVTNSLYKSFEYFAGGMGGITLYDGGYFYFYNDTNVAVYTYFTDVFDGVTQFSTGIDYGIVTEKEGEEGVYGYESALLAAGLLEEGEALFDLRYTADGEIETSFILALSGEVDVQVGDKKFTVDKWGDLTFGEKTYVYGEYEINDIYDSAYTDEDGNGYSLREYIFGDTKVCLRASDDDYLFDTVVGENELLELVMKRYPGQSDYFDRIYFIEGLPTDEKHEKRAGILLFVSDGGDDYYEEVLLYGDVFYSPEAEIYTLMLDYPDDEDLEEFYYAYGGEEGILFFAIETFEGRVAAVYLDTSLPGVEEAVTAEDGSTLGFDYYGNATYTPAEGEAFKGTGELLAAYEDIVDSTDGYTYVTISLFSVTSETGEEMFFLVNHEEVYEDYSEYPSEVKDTFSVVTAPEAGNYSYMSSETGMISFSDYVVFFGGEQGKGIFYQTYIDRTGNEVRNLGTYQSNDLEIDIGGEVLTEYQLTYEDEYGDEQVTYIAAGTVRIQGMDGEDLGTARVFIERMMPMGDYAVEGGGRVYGNGYDLSEYTDAEGTVWYGEFGRENLIDTSPKQSEYGVEEGDHSKDGKQLFFYAYYLKPKGSTDMYALTETRHFLFDVKTDDGEDYLALRDDVSGTVALFENGAINEGTLFYFDGHGNGTLKKQGSADVAGTYTYDKDANLGVFTPTTGKAITFAVYSLRQNGETWNIIVDTAEEHLYMNADWSVLSLKALGSYGTDGEIYSGVYTDRYGASYYGIYEYFTENIISFSTETEILYFNVTDKGTFTLNEDEFVVDGGVLYAYQGSTYLPNGLKIPDGVIEIADGVFSYMNIKVSLDLNKVEKIGARAFYQTYIGEHELNSEFVTEIGEEAFYTDGTYDYVFDSDRYDTAFNFLTNVNMPKLQTIGARAFYYANQMGVLGGTVTLRDIKSIGEQAFMHNVNPSSGTMKLDLTQVPDLSKLTIAETAFDDTLLGAMNPDGLPPVAIRINFTQLSQTGSWPEKFKGWFSYADIKSDPALAGKGFLSAAGDTYYEFVASSEALGLPSVNVYQNGGWSWEQQTDAYLWSVEESGDTKTVYLYSDVNGTWMKTEISFAPTATTIDLNGATCYRTDTEHTLTVKEGDAETPVEFTFNFEVEITSFMFGPDVSVTVTAATYGGKDADYPSWSDGDINFNYAEGNDVYQVTVNCTDKTSTKSLSERVVSTTDGTYRATFGSFTQSGTPYYLKKLEKKNGEQYDVIMSSSVSGESGTFTYTKETKADGVVTTTVYTVTYAGGLASPTVTVNEVTSTKYEITVEATEKNKYRATFLAATEEATEMEALTKFEVYKDYGAFEEVYGATIEKGTEANTFTVTDENRSGATVYTVKYVAEETPHIEVTVKSQTVKTVETEHEEGTDYYEVNFVVDQDGKIVGLQSIKTHKEYNGWWYNDEMTYDANNVTRTDNGNEVTFVFSTDYDKFTVVIDTTNAASGQYTATVTMQSI